MHIVVVGGDTAEGWTDAAEAWDPERGSRLEVPRLPRQRRSFACAALQGRLYIIGGVDAEDAELSSVEVLHVASGGIWLRGVPPMQCARAGAVAAAVDGKIYVAGGNGGDLAGYLRGAEALCPGAGGGPWGRVPSMRCSRADAGAAVLGGKFYVAGGRNDTGILQSVERFDPARDSWEEVPPMQTPRAHCAAVALGASVLAVGGFNDSIYLSSVEAYDAESGHWTFIAPLECPRAGHAAIPMAGSVYVLGGQHEGDILDVVERYDPAPALGEGFAAPSAVWRVSANRFACVSSDARLPPSSAPDRDPHSSCLSARGAPLFDGDGALLQCFICYEAFPDAMLLECGHSGLCVGCALLLPRQEAKAGRASCPVCRAPVLGILKLRESSGGLGLPQTPVPVEVVGIWTSLPSVIAPRVGCGVAACTLADIGCTSDDDDPDCDDCVG